MSGGAGSGGGSSGFLTAYDEAGGVEYTPGILYNWATFIGQHYGKDVVSADDNGNVTIHEDPFDTSADSDVGAYDPATDLVTLGGKTADYDSAIDKTFIESTVLNYVENWWDSIVDKVTGYISAQGLYSDPYSDISSGISSIVSAALSSAASVAADTLADSIAASTDANGIVDDSVARASTELANAVTQLGTSTTTASIGSVSAAADTEAEDSTDKALTAVHGNAETESVDFVTTQSTTALSTVTTDVLVDIATAIVGSAVTGLGDVVTSAVTAANSVVNGSTIDNAVASFRTNQGTDHMRAVNRYTGAFVEGNATNSSAFLLGLSLMESEFAQQVADFRSKLETEMYSRVYDNYMQVYMQEMQAGISAYGQQLDSYIRMYNAVLPGFMQTFLTSFSQFFQAYLQEYTAHANLHDSLTRLGAQTATQLDTTQKQVFQNLASQELQGYLSLKGQRDANEQSLIEQAVTTMTSSMFSWIDTNRINAQLYLDYIKTQIAAYSEYRDTYRNYAAERLEWPLDIWQKAGNIIATGAGGVNSRPERRGRSTLGQALVGASAGMQVASSIGAGAAKGSAMGAAGGPWGMAIGAAIGAGAGLLAQ